MMGPIKEWPMGLYSLPNRAGTLVLMHQVMVKDFPTLSWIIVERNP